MAVSDSGFGVTAGTTLSFDDSVCRPMADRRGPAYAPDVRLIPAYADVPQVAEMGIRAYMGLAIRDGEGVLRGTLCGFDSQPQPPELARNLGVVRLLGGPLAAILARQV